MKKSLKDAFSKTPFTFNDKIYKLIDGVSMGVSFSTSFNKYFHDRTREGYNTKVNREKFY